MGEPISHLSDDEDLLGVKRRIVLPSIAVPMEKTDRRGIVKRSVSEAIDAPIDGITIDFSTEHPNEPPRLAIPRTSGEAAALNRNRRAQEPEFEAEQRRREILRNALGPLQTLLKRPTISDVLRNPDGRVFVIEVGRPKYELGGHAMTDIQANQLIGAVATYAKRTVDEKNPSLEAILPEDGSRFTAMIPPATFPGPLIAIRKHAVLKRTLDDYVASGALDTRGLVTLRKSIQAHDNFLIVGSTGSGKTTFANALLTEMSENAAERFVIFEDNRELQCPADDVVNLQTTPDLSMNDLLRRVLRLSPDRICVGELRGPEAHVLIKAWNTGHKGGLTTIHAENAIKGLTRLEECVEEANVPVKRSRIAQAVQCIVVIARTDTGIRRITEIRKLVDGDDLNGYRFEK